VAGTGEMEAIRGAFEIELGGMAFYVRAAEEAKDADLKKLFQRFSAMEREHMALLTSRYHIEPFGPGTVTHIDQTAIYGPGILSVPDDAASVFRTAIAFEQRAADFFTARETRFPEGSAARKLYRELAEEEREHVDMLRTEYARFRQGKPGLL